MGHRSSGRPPQGWYPRRWPGNKRIRKAISAVRDAIRTSEAGLANPTSSHQLSTPTSCDGIHDIFPAPPRLTALACACPGPPSEFSTCFSDAPANHSADVWAVAPGVNPSLALSKHGPRLVGGTITLDYAYFSTKIADHSGANALAPFGCVALFDIGSPQTFIRRDVLDRMLSVGATTTACEQKCAPRSWGSSSESAPLQASTRVRLSVRFFEPMSPRAP